MIEKELQNFLAVREMTMRTFDRLGQPQLDFKPSPDKWSVGETLDHIFLAGQLGIRHFQTLFDLQWSGREPYLNLTFAELNVAPFFIPKSVLPFFEVPFAVSSAFTPQCVKDILIGNRLFAAKNPDVAEPRPGRSSDELKNDLNASAKELEALFAANRDLNFQAMKISHPVFGLYDAPGYLRFMSQHEQRHQAQIAEIIGNARFFEAG